MDIAIGMTSTDHSEEDARARRGLRERGFTRMCPRRSSDRTRSPSLPCRTRVPGPRPRYRRRADPNASPDDAGGPSAHRARAIGGRLSLGIGLSHKAVVEGMWGISFDHPANYMGSTRSPRGRCCVANASTSTGRVSAVTIGALGPRGRANPALLGGGPGGREC